MARNASLVLVVVALAASLAEALQQSRGNPSYTHVVRQEAYVHQHPDQKPHHGNATHRLHTGRSMIDDVLAAAEDFVSSRVLPVLTRMQSQVVVLRGGASDKVKREDEDTSHSDMLGFGIYAILVLILAYFYKSNDLKAGLGIYDPQSVQKPLVENPGSWRYSLFSCLDEPKLTCFTLCCAPVRWADTMSMANIITGFMNGVAGYLCLSCLAQVSGWMCWPCTVGVYTHFRQQLRQAVGLPNGDAASIAEDCCTYCCCLPCAIVQEARQVEELTLEGKSFGAPPDTNAQQA